MADSVGLEGEVGEKLFEAVIGFPVHAVTGADSIWYSHAHTGWARRHRGWRGENREEIEGEEETSIERLVIGTRRNRLKSVIPR